MPIAPLFQLYWATVLFMKYRKYAHLYDGASFGGEKKSGRWKNAMNQSGPLAGLLRSLAAALPGWQHISTNAAGHTLMPLLSLGIAAVEVVLLFSLFEASLLQWPQQMIALLSRGHLHLAMVGGAVGIASLYSRRGARWAAIAGVLVNAAMAVTIVSLLVLGLLRK